MKYMKSTPNITKSFKTPRTPKKNRHGSWNKYSKAKRASHPLCEVCKSRVATQVHHIKPLCEGGAELDWSNLQSICDSCHDRVHKPA